jgi:hypothetical protein
MIKTRSEAVSAAKKNGRECVNDNEIDTDNNSDSDSERASADEGDEEKRVDVGFLQDALSELGEREKRLGRMVLKSPFFPSKVGGKPAWLDHNNVPLAAGNTVAAVGQDKTKDTNNNNSATGIKQQPCELKCSNCGSQLSFLLQIYAPNSFTYRHEHLVESYEDSFHRALFVFACLSSSCRPNASRTVLVLRSQLARQNEFFDSEPPPDVHSIYGHDEQALEQELAECGRHVIEFRKRLRHRIKEQQHLNDLCAVCGLSCTKKCSKCLQCFYCSQPHQLLHWTKLGHKELCGKYVASSNDPDKLVADLLTDELDADVRDLNETLQNSKISNARVLLPEYEIVIEPEITNRALLKDAADDKHHAFDYDEKSKQSAILVHSSSFI